MIEEPAVLARQKGSGRALAFGTAALELAADRPGEVEVSWPLGVEQLADIEAAEQFLRQVIFRVVGRLLFSRHELMLGVPAELSTASRRALLQVALPIASWTPLPLVFLLPQAAQVAIVCHEGLLGHRAIAPPPGSWEGEAGLAGLSSLVNELLAELPPSLRDRARESGLAIGGRGLPLAQIGERLAGTTGLAARLLADPDHCVAKGTDVALARIESLGGEGLLYLR